LSLDKHALVPPSSFAIACRWGC